jgi:hypothetical protein
MDFVHCDDFEQFLQDTAFGPHGVSIHDLYLQAVSEIQPASLNLTADEELHQAMDDCWDSEWINPLTGIPHYVAANVLLTGTSFEPDLPPPPQYVHTRPKLCTFCANKYGRDAPRCKTHTVMQCRLLAKTTCLNCGEKGHTVSRCPNKSMVCDEVSSQSSTGSSSQRSTGSRSRMSILDKAGGMPKGI